MRNNNNIIVDLSKVSFAELNYVCHSLGRTYKRNKEPTEPTVNGHEFDCEEKRYHNNSIEPIGETMLDYATRRGILDHWYLELSLQLTANQKLIYTGQKALDIWAAWKNKVFNKKKGK